MGYAVRNDGVYGWRVVRSAKDCRDNETYSKVKPGPYEPTDEDKAADLRAERDARIEAIRWRIERNQSEVRLGQTPTDDIAVLDAYVQALRDVPEQAGFPGAVEWPVCPE
jgi:hypothetical protein